MQTTPTNVQPIVIVEPVLSAFSHIVAAGVSRVVYIDPYPKSLTPDLYPDSIVVDPIIESKSQSKTHFVEPITHVCFESFVGIAPRLYLSLFDSSKIERKDEKGAVVKWVPAENSPRLSEDPKSYITKESFLNDMMNDFFTSSEEPPIKKKEVPHEEKRSNTRGVRKGSRSSKKSSSLDARTRTTKENAKGPGKRKVGRSK